MPIMIAIGAQECLIYGSTDEHVGHGVVTKHIAKRVVLIFGPEGISQLNVCLDGKRGGFCHACKHRRVLWGGYRPLPREELARKELVPASKAVVNRIVRVRHHVSVKKVFEARTVGIMLRLY